MTQKNPKDMFIVDNSDTDWKVERYLREWTQIARAFDIATGYFEIGALLSLDGAWQQLDQIRILMGDEVSRRTRQAFEQALTTITKKLDDSIELTKTENDFLVGVPAIVDALKSGKIQVRVYTKEKFHAKAYITHGKFDVIGSVALVGSSNFTLPGLQQNIELNVQIRDEVDKLQAWYEKHWDEARDVSPDILHVMERHTRDYTPFEVYIRSLTAYFRAHEPSVSEWERNHSRMYRELSQYQREGYHALIQIAERYNGALLCDGVGLGKTFVGLMVIERLLHDRKRIALIVPKAARADVWEAKLKYYLPDALGLFTNLVIINHTDILRDGADYPQKMLDIAQKVDVVIIDEAHHFRNTSSHRARKLFDMLGQNAEGKPKQLFLLTATPINNSLYDLMHLIDLFARRKTDYFKSLGIHSLRGHFRQREEALNRLTNATGEMDMRQAEELMHQDNLFRALVVQRSRGYARQSLRAEGGDVIFPTRHDPRVANYSLTKTYGRLLSMFSDTFSRDAPLLKLTLYYPLAHSKKSQEQLEKQDIAMEKGRQSQIVALIRTLLLKRFESSPASFEASCQDLLLKLLAFLRLHDEKRAKTWERHHTKLLDHIKNGRDDEENADEDIIPEDIKLRFEKLNPKEYDIDAILGDVEYDLFELGKFLEELRHIQPQQDDKLGMLVRLLTQDPIFSTQKVLIFTEYRDTAVYLAQQLTANGVGYLDVVHSQTDLSISEAVHRFAPYYNGMTSADLDGGEIRVLIATDILSEGLNLQDATCIINYDLHWNPVRLMQRIGRVHRRLDPRIEQRLITDHPHTEAVRGQAFLVNFLPPQELNSLLSLYERVTQKTVRISKTFGIEGRKLLTPDDDYEALREFNEAYEGTTTDAEQMYLAYQDLLKQYPDILQWADGLPKRIFSGKDYPLRDTQAIFFCYRLPAKNADGIWDETADFTRWYVYYLANDQIIDDPVRIMPLIQSDVDTPRHVRLTQLRLSEIRLKMDTHITDTYMKQIQAEQGIHATLLAWMELG